MKNMKTYAIMAAALLIMTSAHATTYYVRASGSTPTSPYTSWATAAAIPDSAVAAGNQDRGGDGNHKIFIAPGVYHGKLKLDDTDWANGTITGLASLDTTDVAALDQVIIYAGNAIGIQIGSAGITVNNITITNGTGSYDLLYCSAGTCVMNNIRAYNAARYLLNLNGGAITFNRCEFAGTKAANTGGFFTQSTSDYLKMNFCTICKSDSFAVGGTTSTTGCIKNGSNTCTVTLNNCLISGAQNYAVINSGTGTVNINNCEFSNNGYVDAEGATLYNGSGGTMNTTNCLIVGNPFSQRSTINERIFYNTSTIGQTNNIATPNRFPRFKYPARKGFIVPCTDDLTENGVAYAESLSVLFKQHGVSGTYFADMYGWGTSNYAARTIALSNAYWNGTGGIEIGAHTRSHANLRLYNGAPILKKGGITTPASATITISRSLDRILIGTDSLTIGTTKTYKDKTWASIKTALTAAGCTLAADSLSSTVGIKSTCLGEVLQDSDGAQASGYYPKIYIPTDSTKWATEGFLYSEMVDAKALMESRLNHTVYSFASTYGTVNDTVRTVASAAGYNGLRRALNVSGASIASFKLSSLNVYDQGYLSWEYWVDPACGGASPGDTTVTKELIEWLCDYVEQTGAVVYLLAHHQPNSTYAEAPLAHWAAALGVMKKHPTITVCSMYEAMNSIRNSSEYTQLNAWTYSKRWTSTADYRPQAIIENDAFNSPALHAGASIFASTVRDKNGRLPIGTPGIGPFYMVKTAPSGGEITMELR